jgi:hypothetical protein
VCDGDDLNVRVIDKFWSKWYELILLFCFMWLSSRMASPSRWLMIASHRNESMNTCEPCSCSCTFCHLQLLQSTGRVGMIQTCFSGGSVVRASPPGWGGTHSHSLFV